MMRNRLMVVGVIGFLVLFGAWRGVIAQEATPAPPAEVTVSENVTLEPIAFGMAEELPPAPAVLQLVRVRVAPGAEFSEPDGDPGEALIAVESGTLTVSLTRPAVVTRGLGGDKESIPANAAFQLHAGESVVAPPGSGGTFRNEGTEEAVLLGAGIRPAGEEMGTPTADYS
jgi:quercetin dioxygenase-like cupin family protein